VPHMRARVAAGDGRARPWAWAWEWRGEAGRQASGERARRGPVLPLTLHDGGSYNSRVT
jgi:hypothetical protein